ncbi:hypothetical protein Z517_09288 [Fonsecaea pedrosoi CBS 271.37]|uniref:Uncharacterized protein n=1 Tax=Fonsecaea pedrosoi CBS 271.37 TaxID=1442368 RepID=A0A0D2GWV5_9EURO|nr:uncharacterized protein Z517_09288 [Fonsecaea pedrosoi CBS 271.37]KIW76844.1 hypothetical protein Z517_09288 [Fonsecaea pedrosoi CBS 271.37]
MTVSESGHLDAFPMRSVAVVQFAPGAEYAADVSIPTCSCPPGRSSRKKMITHGLLTGSISAFPISHMKSSFWSAPEQEEDVVQNFAFKVNDGPHGGTGTGNGMMMGDVTNMYILPCPSPLLVVDHGLVRHVLHDRPPPDSLPDGEGQPVRPDAHDSWVRGATGKATLLTGALIPATSDNSCDAVGDSICHHEAIFLPVDVVRDVLHHDGLGRDRPPDHPLVLVRQLVEAAAGPEHGKSSKNRMFPPCLSKGTSMVTTSSLYPSADTTVSESVASLMTT